MRDLAGLEPWLEPYATYLLSLAQGRVQVTSTRRTRAEQTRLYAAFVNGQSRYPAAPPGSSWHEYGRAFDITGPPEWLDYLGKVWQSWGGTWGGAFHKIDPIHFQA